MKKYLWLLMLLFAVACGPAAEEAPAETDANEAGVSEVETEAVTETTETDSEDAAEESTEVAAPEESESEEVVVEDVETAVSTITRDLAGFAAALTPAEASDVREFDWVKGAENPDVVIIEYGDFQ